MDSEPKTDRDLYIEKLQNKLQKAGKAGRFLKGEDGSIVTEFAQEQINGLLKLIAGKSLLDKPTEYSYSVGQLHAYQKLLQSINSDAGTNTQELKNNLEAARNDG